MTLVAPSLNHIRAISSAPLAMASSSLVPGLYETLEKPRSERETSPLGSSLTRTPAMA